MKIIIAILIFSAIILFHELGHFLLAKKNGVIVTEFSLGMGPRLLSTVKGGTRYSLKLLPLGGSCMMLGEDEEENSEGSFNRASVWARISIIAAGPVFNFIFAFVLAFILISFIGYVPSRVMEVEEGSQAAEAGLQEGDIITEFNGYHIDIGKDLYTYLTLNTLDSTPITLTYERDGKEQEITYEPEEIKRYLMGFNLVQGNEEDPVQVESLIANMPASAAGLEEGDILTSINGTETPDIKTYSEYILENPLTDAPVTITFERNGLSYEEEIIPETYSTYSQGFSYNIGSTKTTGWNVIKYSAVEVKYWIRTTLLSLSKLVTGQFGIKDLSGPVGVVDVIGDVYEQAQDEGALMLWMNMINMAILLSANLGVMNLLPIPALDGGRLLFLIVEAVRRKPLNRQVEGMIHFAGLMVLLALMAVVMFNDVMRIF